MPGFTRIVNGQPIVFTAYLNQMEATDFQKTFNEMAKIVKKNKKGGQIWQIIDLTAWDVNYLELAGWVGAMADRLPGSPYDSNIVPLLVGPESLIQALKKALTDHRLSSQIPAFDNLNDAYEFARDTIQYLH